MILASYILALSFLAVLVQTEKVTLLFAGDISFSGPVKYYVEHNYHSYNDSFSDVATLIREADIAVANLESPFVSEDVYPYQDKEKVVILDSSPKAVSALSFAGFDAITLANNHMNDFGSKGANFTVQVLKEAGIKYFGVTYGKFNSSQEPLIMERNGLKIGFLGYCDDILHHGKNNCTGIRSMFTSGPAIYQDTIATNDVMKLKAANVDIIVVFMHWGKELLLEPLPYQLHITKHLVSLGVQVIIGSHLHVLQRHCIHGNKFVTYSLGNFLFPPTRLLGGNDPNLYGRLGRKPDKVMIQVYEQYSLGNKVFKYLNLSQMFKVTVTRNGVLEAKYFPLEMAFDPKTKRLHPKPTKNAKWITVCGEKDKDCHECFIKQNIRKNHK
ncbi:capsule biosynthesis protein CapA-like [Oculina patagonica]